MIEKLIQKLESDEKYITLEITPTHNPEISQILDSVKKYDLYKKVDGFTVTDNPLAKLKYSSILGGIKIQQEFNKPVITTISMRDRNKIALQSDLLGANDFDIRAILALTGDPARMSDQPHTKAVFEGNSNLLLEIIQSFNLGFDFAGKPFKIKPKHIYPFTVVNSFAKSKSRIAKKIEQKIANGTVGIISQPVFDIENAKWLLEIFNNEKGKFTNSKTQLIIGIFPILKLRTAQFLSAHVPGIFVPKSWLEKLEKASKISEIEERRVGIELSQNLYQELNKIHNKFHIMTANNFDIANELL